MRARAGDERRLLALLRARADEIMLGQVSLPGLFFQLDTDTGATTTSCSAGATRVRRSTTARSRSSRGTSASAPGSKSAFRKDRARAHRRPHRHLPGGAHDQGERRRHRPPVAPGRRAVLGARSDPIAPDLDGARRRARRGRLRRGSPGSHKQGLATPLGGVIPHEHVARCAADASLPLPAAAGEALLLHNHVWHRSLTNRTGKTRRAFSICYMSAATQCTRKKRAPRDFVRVF